MSRSTSGQRIDAETLARTFVDPSPIRQPEGVPKLPVPSVHKTDELCPPTLDSQRNAHPPGHLQLTACTLIRPFPTICLSCAPKTLSAGIRSKTQVIAYQKSHSDRQPAVPLHKVFGGGHSLPSTLGTRAGLEDSHNCVFHPLIIRANGVTFISTARNARLLEFESVDPRAPHSTDQWGHARLGQP
jgi:hypothetical protein